MNFGLVILSWVVWIVACGFNAEVPKPNTLWMGVAAIIALANQSREVIIKYPDKE